MKYIAWLSQQTEFESGFKAVTGWLDTNVYPVFPFSSDVYTGIGTWHEYEI